MSESKKSYLHKASINFEIQSENDASNIKDEEILSSLKNRVESLEVKPGTSLLEEIDIQESYEFNYDSVDVNELINTGGARPGMGW